MLLANSASYGRFESMFVSVVMKTKYCPGIQTHQSNTALLSLCASSLSSTEEHINGDWVRDCVIVKS